MIINNQFNTNYIIKCLEAFNKSNWKAAEVSVEFLQQFINDHRKIIANQQNKDLHDQLMRLSDRITEKWTDPEANTLSFVIMAIAKGVFKESEAPALPDTLWGEIISHIPPRAPAAANLPFMRGGAPSGLEEIYPSKKISYMASCEETKWAGEELISLKKYAKTAKEAVNYLKIKQSTVRVTGANLSEFPDLEEEDLQQLYKACPGINQLFIKSDNIKKLPPEAANLKTLICSNCTNLQELPKLALVEVLDCSGCKTLQKLPELPLVQVLNCRGCSFNQLPPLAATLQKLYCGVCTNLTQLPDLPEKLEELQCSSIHHLTKIPMLPISLRKLDISDCAIDQIPALPPKLQTLMCGECLLDQLPQLPDSLQVLYCCHNPGLNQLPKLPDSLINLVCSWTPLTQLPELPAALQFLDCENCPLDEESQRRAEACQKLGPLS